MTTIYIQKYQNEHFENVQNIVYFRKILKFIDLRFCVVLSYFQKNKTLKTSLTKVKMFIVIFIVSLDAKFIATLILNVKLIV